MKAHWREFLYLAYLDDSDTRSKGGDWKVLSAVIVKDTDFSSLEFISSLVIEDLMPSAKLTEFSEFHACELYGGYGVFEGIEQDKRFEAVQRILENIAAIPISIVYGAVNATVLAKQVYASADPLDIAFRLCADGVQRWMSDKQVKAIGERPDIAAIALAESPLALLVVDDCDKKVKETLHRSFRSLRPPVRPPNHSSGQLCYVHDDMYFGDSK